MDKTYACKSWTEIELAITNLVKKLETKRMEFKTISTVSRGGLVPAKMLADRMAIKQILVDAESIPEDSLFVDDIYDSGQTFRKIIQRAKKPDSLIFATIYARKGQNYPKHLIYAEITNGSEYIVFPWDRFEHGIANSV